MLILQIAYDKYLNIIKNVIYLSEKNLKKNFIY